VAAGETLNFFLKGSAAMKRIVRCLRRVHAGARGFSIAAFSLLLAAPAFAQTGNSPWENAVNVLQQAFTSTIARGLSLVAIVVSGLTFARHQNQRRGFCERRSLSRKTSGPAFRFRSR
jgi:type IV secretory pathway VirB2 component (pilin)